MGYAAAPTPLRTAVPSAPTWRWGPAAEEALISAVMRAQQQGGGAIEVVAGSPDSLRACIGLLLLLLQHFEMDGLVVTTGRPARIYQQALRHWGVQRQPLTADLVRPLLEGLSATKVASARTVDPDSIAIEDPFDLPGLVRQLRLGLEQVARRHGGEIYFVLVEDLEPLEAYNPRATVDRFAIELGSQLHEVGACAFFVTTPDRLGRFGRKVPSVRYGLS